MGRKRSNLILFCKKEDGSLVTGELDQQTIEYLFCRECLLFGRETVIPYI